MLGQYLAQVNYYYLYMMKDRLVGWRGQRGKRGGWDEEGAA